MEAGRFERGCLLKGGELRRIGWGGRIRRLTPYAQKALKSLVSNVPEDLACFQSKPEEAILGILILQSVSKTVVGNGKDRPQPKSSTKQIRQSNLPRMLTIVRSGAPTPTSTSLSTAVVPCSSFFVVFDC
jgi:hypothetical protein